MELEERKEKNKRKSDPVRKIASEAEQASMAYLDDDVEESVFHSDF